ncbi:glutamine amidotransferase [Halovibrio salipaludis]|uniref:Glutamine amidotransferase n=1 Tax=Halovibrio salipaludis TaxID=2032626 RepID=A0A2A2F5B8_9GAMM|nr:glutamine amidotransferase [Halovibrio salipaludis]PAU80108.1 glutamine amidotransferase [Halovibrio salipaludis]
MLKRAVAIRHLAFEDLGGLEKILLRNGYKVSYREAGKDDLGAIEQAQPDLLVVLGAPISVNDTDAYPFVQQELSLIQRLSERGTAVLGICLGAQLIARALGAGVKAMPQKEIGFAPLELTEKGRESALAPLEGIPVLHWHGEACGPVSGAPPLARTQACDNQAFQPSPRILGLQFHLEVPLQDFECWLIGHCSELAAAGLSVPDLRRDAAQSLPQLESLATDVFQRWLDGL